MSQNDAGRCFVIQPFDNGTFDKRFADVFKPAIEAAGLEAYRVDRDPGVDVPIDEIERGITDSTACFGEITSDNPNVWYEVGYARAAGKPLCLVCSSERASKFPFDVQHRSIIRYDVRSPSDFSELEQKITQRLSAVLKKQGEIDTLSSLKPTASMEGLSPHEVAILALIMAQFESDGVTGWQMKQDMKRAGYTDIAAGLAIEKLRRSQHIAVQQAQDDRGDFYSAWVLTDKGRQWLIDNEAALRLREEDPGVEAPPLEFGEEDLPF